MSIAILGEAIVDLIAQKNGMFQPHLGGSPFNVAVAAARQGCEVSYVSPLSDDGFGQQFSQRLSMEGINHTNKGCSSLPTSIALITLDDKGQPHYRLYRDNVADKDANAEALIKSIPPDTKIFHTGSLAITPDYLPTVSRVIKAMRARNVLISIDINIRDKAYPDINEYVRGVESLLTMADIVKASDEDLYFFDPELSAKVQAKKILNNMQEGLVLLTCGEDGGALLSGQQEIPFQAKRAGNFIDPIGAGDTFYATFLCCIVEQEDSPNSGEFRANSNDEHSFLDAINRATLAAAINVSRAGCNPPTRSEIERVILGE